MTMASLGVLSYLRLDVPVTIERPGPGEWYIVSSPGGFPLYVSGEGSDNDALGEAQTALEMLAQSLVDEADPVDFVGSLVSNRIGFEVRFVGEHRTQRLSAEARER